MSTKSNSLDIATQNQDITITSDFVGSIGILNLKKGQITAKISKLGFSFGLGFDTQEADFVPGTGKAVGEEQAPAIKILDLKMDLDTADTSIDISGSWEYWITSKLIGVFKKSIFSTLISELEKITTKTLDSKINSELKEYGSHYVVDGFGIDFAQIQKPKVTNDELLTMYFNGTFISERGQLGKSGE